MMDCRCLIGLLFIAAIANGESIYKTCDEIDYCKRLREKESADNFQVVRNSVVIHLEQIGLYLNNLETGRVVFFNISVYDNHVIRLKAEELDRERYNVQNVFTEGRESIWMNSVVTEDRAVITGFNHSANYSVVANISFNPFEVNIYVEDVWILSFNHDRRFTMESNDDSTAFAFDVFFPQAFRAYGIPEHADSLALKTTTGTDSPYRLWNSDVPAYDIDSRMGLYGSVPLLYGHAATYTSGIFLPNGAEQWVDITNTFDGVNAYFMVEKGAFDLHILYGPSPDEVAVQYTSLTGTAPLPQLWALGYHQGRRSYVDQGTILDVVEKFDKAGIELDAIWGDIETQDGHRYFTWHPDTFGDSRAMLDELDSTHRKFIPLADPHVKVDTDYFVYNEGNDRGYFVQTSEGTNYEGQCRPGNSVWVDFFNSAASDWWATLFNYNRFQNTTSALGGFWTDLNEPSLFDDDNENTLPRNVVHHEDVVHSDVHNLYGFEHARATYEGLMERDGRAVRPFVVSRSFFAGSQRYSGVWTGDNVADWEHLRMTFPMCLSLSISGISMCGADVGGFYGDPDTELLTRWYQIGAWLPFFRAHASNDTQRREPYVFDDEVVDRIRAAIHTRYVHLPEFYTKFYEHSRYGYPVIRPLFFQFPSEVGVISIDDQLLIGNNIMVKQVSESYATNVPVYFPGGSETLWYDINTPLLYRGLRYIDVPVTLDAIPAYYKGGSIIFKRNTPRRNTYEMEHDPYTVYIFLDDQNEAYGTIYTDDYHTFAYVRREFQYFLLFYENDSLFMRPVDPDMPETHPDLVIESYYIYRPPASSRSADGPVPVSPIIVTKTADGRNVKDIPFSSREIIKLL